MKKLFHTSLVVLTLLISTTSGPALAASNKLFSPCDVNKYTATSPICKDRDTTTNPVNQKIKTAADIVAIATGVAAVILIIIGGFTMVTSAGNTEAVASARKRVTYAVIGLVIVALAWTIIAFVTNSLLT